MSDVAANRFPHGGAGLDERRTPAEIEQDLGIGSLVDLRLLRAGPAASLFRARQIATQRRVAVKVLHDELSSDTGQRFDRERAITGQLSGHTGIVPLFDTGVTTDGEPYLVMPFYARGSMADLMERYGPLPWQEAAFLLEPMAVTLAEVHSCGLVHRNVKPGNILLTDFLLPRLVDFGMCLPVGQDSTTATLIEPSPMAAPEVGTIGPADARADVFGLGATLRSLLAGHPPHRPDRRRSDGVDLGDAGVRGPASEPDHDPIPGAPEPIADLIRRSMDPDPGRRPINAAQFVTELRDGVGDAGTVAPNPPLLEPSPRSGGPATTSTRPGRIRRSEPNVGPADDEQGRTGLPSTPEPPTGGSGLEPAPPGPGRGGDGVVTGRAGPAPSETRAPTSTEFYLLFLVAVISTGILIMVAAAVLAVN